ncbi:hypothetical protein H9P43_004538 [Blastocladiella emersonii ATCC 22665]|nr:hypothetical protein H9P43_004538 [Blastocladiella emersonii ATCC 22665]
MTSSASLLLFAKSVAGGLAVSAVAASAATAVVLRVSYGYHSLVLRRAAATAAAATAKPDKNAKYRHPSGSSLFGTAGNDDWELRNGFAGSESTKARAAHEANKE